MLTVLCFVEFVEHRPIVFPTTKLFTVDASSQHHSMIATKSAIKLSDHTSALIRLTEKAGVRSYYVTQRYDILLK